MRTILSCVMLLVIVMSLPAVGAGPAGADTSKPATRPASAPALAERIKALIAQLGDDEYKVREQANDELIEIGPPAKPALTAALESKDMEVQTRAARILKEIQSRVYTVKTKYINTGLLWSLELESGTNCTPVAADGKIFVLSPDNKLHAVDAKTGKPAFTADLPEDLAITTGLAAAGDVLCVGDIDRNLVGLSIKDGSLKWRAKGAEAQEWPWRGVPPHAKPVSTPAPAMQWPAPITDGKNFYHAGLGKLMAVDAATGKAKWLLKLKEQETGQPVFDSGVVAVWEDSAMTGKDAVVIGAKADSGETAWTMDRQAKVMALRASGGTLFVLDAKGLAAADIKTGKIAWTKKMDVPDIAYGRLSGIVNGRHRVTDGGTCARPLLELAGELAIVIHKGRAWAIDLAKGETKWETWLDLADNLEDDGLVQAEEARLTQAHVGSLAWPKIIIDGRITSICPPAWLLPCKDALVLGNSDGVLALEPATGKRLWKLDVSGAAMARPALLDGTLLIPGQPMPDRAGSPQPQLTRKCGLHAVKLP